MKTQFETLTGNINELKEESKYNKSSIFTRARYIYKNSICTWSEALKQSWYEAKNVISKKRIELKQTISRLAKAFEVKFSHEYLQEQLNKQMLRGYELGSEMN